MRGNGRLHDDQMVARFAANLYWLRQGRKLSQVALADRAGIHRTQISLLENGVRQPLITTAVALAGALEVPVEVLLTGIRFEHSGPEGPRYTVEPPPEFPFPFVSSPSEVEAV
jgi:transcriptional regulator with XRE-family HTH domain